jgi:hypothetical protein
MFFKVQILNIKASSKDEQEKLNEEKKQDFDHHTELSEEFEKDVKNRILKVEDVEQKRLRI